MLSIRTRGKNGIYYIRGSVSLGDKHIEVQEFSLRTIDRDAAAHLMAEHETKLRHQLMFGPAALVAQGTIADAFDSYLSKAKPPCPSDILRIGQAQQPHRRLQPARTQAGVGAFSPRLSDRP